MKKSDYQDLLVALSTASRILTANEGDLNPADLRIRCLVNITNKEVSRAMLEAEEPAPRETATEDSALHSR